MVKLRNKAYKETVQNLSKKIIIKITVALLPPKYPTTKVLDSVHGVTEVNDDRNNVHNKDLDEGTIDRRSLRYTGWPKKWGNFWFLTSLKHLNQLA